MLTEIPPYTLFENEISYMPCVFEVFCQTARDAVYKSRGEDRGAEQHCIFHYTLSGCGEVIYNGVAYRVNAGQGFFNVINEKGCGYGYPQNGTEPWRFIVICLDGVGVREVIAELCRQNTVYGLDESDFLNLCRELFYSQESRLTFLSRLVLKLSQNISEERLVKDFRRIADGLIEENPTVSGIAMQMGVSREHLSREYLEKTGETPAGYVKRRRYELLCFLIASGVPFAEIAGRMRFPSVSGMSLFFKKISGSSPSEYRKKGYLKV